MAHPGTLMEPDVFLNAVGDFPVEKASDPVTTLVLLWNGEMIRAVDMITPEHPFWHYEA